MGRDKAGLLYRGRTQLSRTLELAGTVCEKVFLSLRAEQTSPMHSDLSGVELLRDRWPSQGPVTGILTALEAHPGHPWLVLAVDLPFLNRATLQTLVARRDSSCPFTAFRSSRDGRPEPLCAIYEPFCLEILRDCVLRRNLLSPRRILLESNTHLLDLLDPRVLDNVNTEEEYRGAARQL